MIVTSTESLRRDTERILLRRSGGCLFGPQVLSIRQFALDLAMPDKTVAARWMRRVAIGVALKGARLVHFMRVRETPGTINLFDRAIQALKRGGCTTAMLREWFATRGGPAEYDLLQVFEKYEEGGFALIDDGDVFLKAAARLKSGPPPPPLRDVAAIECAGFQADDPLISLFRQASPIPVKISSPASELPTPVSPDTIAVATPMQEARWIAEHCAKTVAEGYEPEDMGIVVPGDWYRELLLKQLSIAGFQTATSATGRPSSSVFRRILQDAHSSAPGKMLPLAGWIDKLEALLKDNTDAVRWVEEYRDRSGGTSAGVSFRLLASLNDFVSRVSDMEAKEIELAGELFFDLLEDAIDKDPPSQTDEGPRIFSFDSLPTAPLKEIVFAHGLEGVVPPAPESFQFCSGPEFRDTECTLLRQCLPTVEEQNAQLRLRWDEWRSLATNVFIVTYPISGIDGRETVSSSLLPPVEEHLFEDAHPPLIPLPFRHTTGGQAREGRINPTDPAIKAHIGARFRSHRFSVSQLETFARSPFAFFCERVLSLEPDEEETPDISSRQRGIVIHAMLERFVKENMSSPPAEERIGRILRHIADEAIRDHQNELRQFHPSLVERLKNDAVLLCVRAVTADIKTRSSLSRPLKPMATEWKFGNDSVPPLTIEVPGDAPIELSGTVDRVDGDEDHFAIYDYKTGNPDSPRTGIYAGRHFQLPIYMSAVESLLLPRAEAVAGMLILLGGELKQKGIARRTHNEQNIGLSPKSRSLVDDDEWRRLRASAEEHLRKTVGTIRNAEFPADAHECKSWCAWRKTCGHALKD